MTIPSPTAANRLALGLMDAREIGYPEAVAILEGLTLSLVCDDSIRRSASLQAALVTALNSGLRAFLGGVEVQLPKNVTLLIPWPGRMTLNEVVHKLVGARNHIVLSPSHTVYFGHRPAESRPHALVVRATGWRGGMEPAAKDSRFDEGGGVDFALGGIYAGGLSVHRGFLRATAISAFACNKSAGLSLWNPGADWTSAGAEGPPLRALPAGLWLLGLGHLGQAFLWTLGLLPFSAPSDCEVMLQDFDLVEEANVGAGLLCGTADIGTLKTRVCMRWLEERRFRTRLCERPFDESIRREAAEPAIALCGFDKAAPRRKLEDAGFLRVIECGLGGSINDFDLIHVHNFPGARKAADIWKGIGDMPKPKAKVMAGFATSEEVCGALAATTAGKSVSTSFIGAMASAVVFGELLRAYHRGKRHDELFLSPRNMIDCDFACSDQTYTAACIAAAGFAKTG